MFSYCFLELVRCFIASAVQITPIMWPRKKSPNLMHNALLLLLHSTTLSLVSVKDPNIQPLTSLQLFYLMAGRCRLIEESRTLPQR